MFLYSLCTGACVVNNTVLGNTKYDTKSGDEIHALQIRLMILFFPLSVAPAQQCILHAGCVFLCCFIVITALPIYLILSLMQEVE